jgi:hypothetical protein
VLTAGEVAEANKVAEEDMETAKIDSLTKMQTKIKNHAKYRQEELLNDALKTIAEEKHHRKRRRVDDEQCEPDELHISEGERDFSIL